MKKTLEQRRAEMAQSMNGRDALEQGGSVMVERKNKYRDLHKEIRDPIALAKLMAEVRERKDKLDDELKLVNAEFDVIRIELIPTLFDDLGLENLRVADLGRVSLTGDVFVSLPAAQKVGLFGWLKKRKLGDLIQENVNSSTLRAFVKDRIKAGKEIPEEFLRVTPYTRASITKG